VHLEVIHSLWKLWICNSYSCRLLDDLNELSPVPAGLDGRSPWWARELLAKLHADSARNPKARVGRRETLGGPI